MLYNTRETKTLSDLSGFSQITPKWKWPQEENVQALGWSCGLTFLDFSVIPINQIISSAEGAGDC